MTTSGRARAPPSCRCTLPLQRAQPADPEQERGRKDEKAWTRGAQDTIKKFKDKYLVSEAFSEDNLKLQHPNAIRIHPRLSQKSVDRRADSTLQVLPLPLRVGHQRIRTYGLVAGLIGAPRSAFSSVYRR